MNLDDAQKQKIAGWLAEGLKLSEIQTRLNTEFGLRLSYMEVRFLIDDLKLKPRDIEPPKATAPVLEAPGAKGAPGAGTAPAGRAVEPDDFEDAPGEAPPAPGRVSVSVDKVMRPGALVSGKVTFSDGKGADWYLDQFGRLGVVPKEQGYKPSPADVQAFQAELQNEMARMGY